MKKYEYVVCNLILIKLQHTVKFRMDTYIGPVSIDKVNDNGTVRVQEGKLVDTYNGRQVAPYRQ